MSGTNADDGQFNPLVPEGPPPGERDDTGADGARVSVPGAKASASGGGASDDPRSDPPPTDEHGEPIDDGMGADDDPDAASEDEPVPGIDE